MDGPEKEIERFIPQPDGALGTGEPVTGDDLEALIAQQIKWFGWVREHTSGRPEPLPDTNPYEDGLSAPL